MALLTSDLEVGDSSPGQVKKFNEVYYLGDEKHFSKVKLVHSVHTIKIPYNLTKFVTKAVMDPSKELTLVYSQQLASFL